MKKMIVIGLVGVAVCAMSSVGKAEVNKPVKPLRVGVYDSRAIAVACLRTEWWNKQVHEKMKEMEKAKAAGDMQKVKELEEWGESNQTKAHLQGFGTAPVKNLLETVKNELAQAAQQAGVDIVVSKWQIDYQVKDAQVVDMTDAIVALYKPSEETLKIVQEMKDVKPVSEEELLKMKD